MKCFNCQRELSVHTMNDKGLFKTNISCQCGLLIPGSHYFKPEVAREQAIQFFQAIRFPRKAETNTKIIEEIVAILRDVKINKRTIARLVKGLKP